MAITESGTYLTASGVLVHSRLFADGRLVIEREDGHDIRAEDVTTKLSDDPDWPDRPAGRGDLTLFVD